MATSRWASSLANIEARIRRSLGIAGPINLDLAEKPSLLPVMLVDDLTRPGCVASDYRGRRWAVSNLTNMVDGLQRGCAFAVAGGLTTLVGNQGKGGVIVDTLELAWRGATITQIVQTEVRYASPFTVQPAVNARDGWMVDPIGPPNGGSAGPGTYETSPMLSGFDIVVPAAGFGQRIWEGHLVTDGRRVVIDLNVFLHEQAFLVFGNSIALVVGQQAQLFWTMRGRVF